MVLFSCSECTKIEKKNTPALDRCAVLSVHAGARHHVAWVEAAAGGPSQMAGGGRRGGGGGGAAVSLKRCCCIAAALSLAHRCWSLLQST
jgi:hypothetical protein